MMLGERSSLYNQNIKADILQNILGTGIKAMLFYLHQSEYRKGNVNIYDNIWVPSESQFLPSIAAIQ